MTSTLCLLTTEDLTQLASALRSGRLAPPFSSLLLRRYIPENLAGSVAAELQKRLSDGMEVRNLATCLEILSDNRRQRTVAEDLIELVWTGPETPGIINRDTSVVVRELFQSAKESVIVAGYAVYNGLILFKELADQMELMPELHVQMFLDIKRPLHGASSPFDLVRAFAQRFVQNEWPGKRLPKVYYDPRSLASDYAARASLHAKCIIIDKARAFVTSANFTEAAQTKNIEAGVLLRFPSFACRLADHFQALAAHGTLSPVPL
jgi:phosphatidylserine/phosphatidylglycerophosphate/cardiolipin synthase-like enzyme